MGPPVNKKLGLCSRYGQSGQATVEYILLLIVSIAIILGLSTKLFTPIKQWSDFYLGSYTNCLLDSGQLPGIAGGQPLECDKMAEAAGFDPKGAGKKKNDPNDAAKAAADAAAKDAADAEAARRSAQANRKTYNNGPRSQQRDDLSGHKGVDAAGGDENVTNVSKLDREGQRSYGSRYGRPKVAKKVGIAGLWEEEREKIRKREERISMKEPEGERDLKPRRMPFNPQARRSASIEEKEVGFSFGNLFRMAIIIMIIVAIVYVLATQINSISKSMEK